MGLGLGGGLRWRGLPERTRRGKRHRALAGVVNALTGAPFGYRYVRKADGQPARYEVIEAEAAVVREVFRRYTEEHASLGGLARWLTATGIRTRRGQPRWSKSSVWIMLRNPAYQGTACFQKTREAERQRITRRLRQRGGIPTRPCVPDRAPAKSGSRSACPPSCPPRSFRWPKSASPRIVALPLGTPSSPRSCKAC